MCETLDLKVTKELEEKTDAFLEELLEVGLTQTNIDFVLCRLKKELKKIDLEKRFKIK